MFWQLLPADEKLRAKAEMRDSPDSPPYFHQLTVLSANKEETGKRFVCDSTSYYLKHPVRAITAFLCNLARISAFGNADREPSLLSAARSFIHSDIYYFLLAGTRVLVSPRETQVSPAISVFREFTI